MSTGPASLVAFLRRRYGPPTADGDLVRAYADRRDEAAFRQIVARHGPMVLAACRRLLRWYADGADLDHAVPTLSTYLGHAQVSDTYWYLTGIPELLNLAAARFEQFAAPDQGVPS